MRSTTDPPADGPPGGPTDARSAGNDPGAAPHWSAFSAVALAFFAVTVAESILAPVLPTLADELGLDLGTAGLALGAMTGAIAFGNLAGGYLLARAGSRASIIGGLSLCSLGCFAVAAAPQAPSFIAGQVLIGAGAGLFFPAGLQAAGHHAGGRRRGLAMGLFGVAFSAGLTVAAILAAIGAELDWRLAFVVAGALSAATVIALAFTPLPMRPTGPPGGRRQPLRAALGPPAVAASIAAICQYGTVAFLPTYAVLSWGMSPVRAAVLLAMARILSVPAKVLSGLASDRFGASRALGSLGVLLTVTGLTWCLFPPSRLVEAAAVVFAATVSAVFPISNVLALEQFGNRGPLLGVFRSVQIGVGAAGAWTLGVLSAVFGLTITLTVTVVLPLGLFAIRAPRTSPVAPPTVP